MTLACASVADGALICGFNPTGATTNCCRYADDRNGNMYYFNVCGDASQVPAACVSLEKAVQAPAYQVTSTDDCFWLGKLRSSEWELIDESEPAAGPSPPSLLRCARRRHTRMCAAAARGPDDRQVKRGTDLNTRSAA